MTHTIVTFIVGFIFGTITGVSLMAVLAVSSNESRREEGNHE